MWNSALVGHPDSDARPALGQVSRSRALRIWSGLGLCAGLIACALSAPGTPSASSAAAEKTPPGVQATAHGPHAAAPLAATDAASAASGAVDGRKRLPTPVPRAASAAR